MRRKELQRENEARLSALLEWDPATNTRLPGRIVPRSLSRQQQHNCLRQHKNGLKKVAEDSLLGTRPTVAHNEEKIQNEPFRILLSSEILPLPLSNRKEITIPDSTSAKEEILDNSSSAIKPTRTVQLITKDVIAKATSSDMKAHNNKRKSIGRVTNVSDDITKAKSNVKKIINFVAITTKEIQKCPFSPKRPPKEPIPVKTERKKVDVPVAPPTRLRKTPTPKVRKPKLRLSMPENLLEEFSEENLGKIYDFKIHPKTASLNRVKKLKMAEVMELTTRRAKTPSPPPPPLQFSDYKRNFITDSLFAGNIYIGQNEEETVTDSDGQENETNKTFSSWRENFQRKMSS